MARFSPQSRDELATCAIRLRALFNRVITGYDCVIIEGHRTPERQQQLYSQGRTKVWHSLHNETPSKAVDVAPWLPGIPWPDKADNALKAYAQWYHFAGHVMCIARDMGIGVRWGGDWDRDGVFVNNTFDDLVHWELW